MTDQQSLSITLADYGAAEDAEILLSLLDAYARDPMGGGEPLSDHARASLVSGMAALTLASAFCSMAGNLLLLYAYRIANATRLAPLVYFQLIAAVVLGWMIFGNLPDAFTWAGLAVIIGAGLASARLR